MSNWRSLEDVPKDGTYVLFWVPENEVFGDGSVVVGMYDSSLDGYFDSADYPIEPIAWMPCPRGPRNMEDIKWT